VPAAAVIPAPKVYTKAVAVKTLVVDFPLLQWFKQAWGLTVSCFLLPCIPNYPFTLLRTPVPYSLLSKGLIQSASTAFEAAPDKACRACASFRLP
jgi:hypothetical protein